MNNTTEKNYLDNQETSVDNKLPSGLNVLTILTIIWACISTLFAIYGFISAKKNYDGRDEAIAKMSDPNMPSWAKAFMPNLDNYEKMITKSYENRLPIAILSLIAIGLCLWGALEMRKRKKQGYIFYLVGTFLPFITSAAFIGLFALTGGAVYFMVFIVLLFVGLYTVQKKHLIY